MAKFFLVCFAVVSGAFCIVALSLPEDESSGSRESIDVETILDTQLVNARMGLGVDKDALDLALEALALESAAAQKPERLALARYWKLAAETVLQTEGSTPLHLSLLETAASLDPEDVALANELAFQRERQQIVQRRLDRAELARKESNQTSGN